LVRATLRGRRTAMTCGRGNSGKGLGSRVRMEIYPRRSFLGFSY
jgi:hypothetical protein